MAKLVSDNFEIPQEHNQPKFILRRLSIQYLELDYEAVMSSKNHLRQVFAANDDWPSDDMTLENNRQDLLWHDDEFERRSSFTYTVLTPNEKKCLGCVYIFAPTMDNFDAEVYLWVREDEIYSGLDQKLCDAVEDWLASTWSLKIIAMPGRKIPWDEWHGAELPQPPVHHLR